MPDAQGAIVSRSVEQLWKRARCYMDADQALPARAVLESILARNPDDTAAHLVLAGLYAADDRQRAAARAALRAARNPPADPGRLGDLISALLKVGEVVEARRLLALPAVAESKSAHVLMRTATQRQLIGEYSEALALVERAYGAGARGRDFHFYRAVQFAFNGHLNESRTEFEHCIALDPPLGRSYVQLARMSTATQESNHLAAIDLALQRVEQGGEDHAALEFARYQELEDLQRYDEAWQALVRGNSMMHASLPHDAGHEAALFDRLFEACSYHFLSTGWKGLHDGPQPIFVIGMPRSGTTVLERMLGNHSQVQSAGELGDFPRALAFAVDHIAASVFDETTIERLHVVDWDAVGRRYLAQSQWRATGKPFYVDKLPRNWMLAGLIHKALPRARILNLVRDPMDVCFSNWRAYFGPGPEYAYAYGLDSLAAHHRRYRETMEHWHAVIPGAILDVEYARLVREPEATARSVLTFCGLPHEPGCVDIVRNSTPSATLSMSQVRQPIHARSFDEWRPYADALQGLQGVLTGYGPIE